MDTKSKILIGALIVSVIGALSMIANYPKMYSPYSFVVVMPTLFASTLGLPGFFTYLLGVLPLAILYLIWSFFFLKQPCMIPKSTIILALTLIALSVTFNIISYEYGIQYQGNTHTLLMYGLNILSMIFMALIFKRNRTKPSCNNSLGFNVFLFSWLGWVAFPWLGELI